MSDRRITVRDACRRRMALDGADAQALEHAITITERERDEALAEVARLRSELAAVLEWRPIESAPRDGTRCLVYERDGYPHKMVFARCYPGDNEWHDQAEGDGYLPTHWLPLPEPPQDGGEG